MNAITNVRRNLLRRSAHLVVVNDGAYRWVGTQRQIYGWLVANGIARGFDRSSNRGNTANMDADQYQSLCDETTCLFGTGGAPCPAGIDPYEMCAAVVNRGAETLYIA